ncbi:MAG TPA: hypothetical protein VGR50_07450 [Terriglobales bacterium]|nr:hypothetical protein [Terriglobales bacterium]
MEGPKMEMRIRILQRTIPSHTSGAQATSVTQLISGTAVPALRSDVNTAEPFLGETLTIRRIFAEAEKPVPPRAKAGKRIDKRAERAAQAQVDYGMIPAFIQKESPSKPPSEAVKMRSAHTPLKTKAEEELGELEREYPW